MTELQFNEIKEILAKYREIRHLTYENQRKDFLGNVFEKVSKYFRAKDDLERVDALCDIAAFCFNVNDVKFSNYECFMKSDKVDCEIFDIVSEINSIIIYKANFEESPVKVFLDTLIALLNKKCKNLCFDFYKCMIETIKEIESHTVEYNAMVGKFLKKRGFYSLDEIKKADLSYLCNNYKIKDIYEKENNFIVDLETPSGIIFNKFPKWYKADYESCRL